jgi:hypothetical protein
MYRYRLVDEASGADLGPFVSMRLMFAVGETIARAPADQFVMANVVHAEQHDGFRAYLLVRRS